MSDVAEILAQARRCWANGDTEGAISLLQTELARFVGDIENRRKLVALLLAYCGRREKIREGLQLGENHLKLDPVSVIDSSVKARLVMNYAALMAASGEVSQAIALLGEMLVCAQSPLVSADEISRAEVMLNSLQVAADNEYNVRADYSLAKDSRSRAYLTSAQVSRLIERKAFSEAVHMSKAVLERQTGLEDGPLKVALMLNLGVALIGEGKWNQAMEWLGRAYSISTRCLMRSGTLSALVAKNYAILLDNVGEKQESVKVLRDLLEAQLVKFGDMHPEVAITRKLLAQVDF